MALFRVIRRFMKAVLSFLDKLAPMTVCDDLITDGAFITLHRTDVKLIDLKI